MTPVDATSRSGADAALRRVCEPLVGSQAVDRWSAEVVEPRDVPEPFSTLLRHNDHMTTTLEMYYGRPVRLRVLGEQVEPENAPREYWRQIELVSGESDEVVEFGAVRIVLAGLPRAVQDEILAKRQPLGDILIRHDLLRRIEPLYFFRFAASSPMAARFGGPSNRPVYGRVGRIVCDERAAIELLEVVSGAEID